MDILVNIQIVPTPIFYLANVHIFRFVQDGPADVALAIVGGTVFAEAFRSVSEDSPPSVASAIVNGAVLGPFARAVVEDSIPGR